LNLTGSVPQLAGLLASLTIQLNRASSPSSLFTKAPASPEQKSLRSVCAGERT
jgi:hypothetical protein